MARSGCSTCDEATHCTHCGPGEGLYHPVEPSTQRIYQSNSYLAYIQGLRLGSETMCDWSRDLAPARDLLSEEGAPSHITIPPWLEKLYTSEGSHGVDSFCSLRDLMLQEALNVVKLA